MLVSAFPTTTRRKAWYTEKLDFRVLQEWPYGELKLAYLYQHMCVHVDDVDEARAELAKRGVDLIGEPFEIEDISRRLAFFRDPWGNMIELSQKLPGAGS
ncbi:VOC family protein [Streptomyces piniterrae]|uniref:VOC family protein n=1 Tax=Streptomyces piniterrae TaxID=2571125 RepID=UPI001FE7AF3D|nr:VOC family protein [Streptomyces piniterrae]